MIQADAFDDFIEQQLELEKFDNDQSELDILCHVF